MPLFESYDRRIKQINEALAKYGIGSIEEAEQLCLSKGINPREIVNGIQPIAFENAGWAYVVGAAIAIKKGCTKAADAAEAIGEYPAGSPHRPGKPPHGGEYRRKQCQHAAQPAGTVW